MISCDGSPHSNTALCCRLYPEAHSPKVPVLCTSRFLGSRSHDDFLLFCLIPFPFAAGVALTDSSILSLVANSLLYKLYPGLSDPHTRHHVGELTCESPESRGSGLLFLTSHPSESHVCQSTELDQQK